MARPISDNPTDHVLQIRTHKTVAARIAQIAKMNHRSTAQECLHAITAHIEEEEKRLGLSSRSYSRLNENLQRIKKHASA